MRVTLTDPQGPRAWRAALRALTILSVVGMVAGFGFGLLAFYFWFGCFSILRVVRLTSERQPSREATLELGAGEIRVRNAGWRSQRIRAPDVTGATTARVAGGYVLSLQHQNRSQPLSLKVETEADLHAVRSALGIGHGGFGTIGWKTEVDPPGRAATMAMILGGLCGAFVLLRFAIAALLPTSALAWSMMPVDVGIALTFFASIVTALIGLGALPTINIVMTASGLQLHTSTGWVTLPYASILDAGVDEETFSFAAAPPLSTAFVRRASRLYGGPSDDEARIILAQIKAAAERARGHGVEKEDVTARLEILQANGQSIREWLARLEATARTFAGGYRGAAIDADDLWAVLEDPDAKPELRVAAARILREHPAPETRARIANAVAAVRDETTSLRLRIAVEDDVDAAARELEELQQLEDLEESPPARART